MLESKFQKHLISKIKERYPRAVILKTDPGYMRSIPDLIILHDNNWVALETKTHSNANQQPNQSFWIIHLNDMSYASFVNPSNIEEVMYEVERSFGS